MTDKGAIAHNDVDFASIQGTDGCVGTDGIEGTYSFTLVLDSTETIATVERYSYWLDACSTQCGEWICSGQCAGHMTATATKVDSRVATPDP